MPLENPANQWTSPESWWQDALNITGHINNVVGPLVPALLGARSADAGKPFRTTGPVEWHLAHDADGRPRIRVQNTGSNEVSMAFTGVNQQTKDSLAQLVVLGPRTDGAPDAARHDISDIIADFTVEAMPTPYLAMVTANKDRTGVSLLNTRLISAVLADVAVGVPQAIPGGLTLTLRQGNKGYELVVTGGFMPVSIEYTCITGAQSISGGAAPHPGRNGEQRQEASVRLPRGTVLNADVTISLFYEIPLSVYEQESRRSRSRRPAAQLVSASA